MQNIGVAFVELSQYNDAVTSFEQVMSESPSLSSGMMGMILSNGGYPQHSFEAMNLVLSCY